MREQPLETPGLEQFAFEIALTGREDSAPQSGVVFGKNHVFPKMIHIEIG